MASIFDKDPNDLPPRQPEAPDRSKKRIGVSPAELVAGKRTLYEMCERAFATLEEAMCSADFNTAVKAAQILLDRSGFGPKTTLDVNTVSIDLTSLTQEQLYARAEKLTANLRAKMLTSGNREAVPAPMPERVQ